MENKENTGTKGIQSSNTDTNSDSKYDEYDVFAYESLGKLSPSWWIKDDDEELEPWLEADKAFDIFLDWISKRKIELWSHQEEALMSLMVGNHVILGTPTGSGKSLVALGMHFMAMSTGLKSYYTAPIKALVSEKFFYLVDILGRDNVGMATGDAQINRDAPVICCTAEVLANIALAEGDRADIGCVAMDEFHFYGDPERGWAWQIPLLTLRKTKFLLMSATLGDTKDIAASLRERTKCDVDIINDAPRPVPLTYEYIETPIEATVELALRKQEAPIYIVHFSQDAALHTANNLANYGVTTKDQRAAIKDALKGIHFSTPFGKILKRLLGSGVGVHHAGMLPRYRLLVEKLAQRGLLPVICGTDTLGVGINVPIHTVILTALTKFDGTRTRRLKAREFHQIVGRAGRSGFDTEGMVLAQAPEHEIENAKLIQKAEGDPKKLRKIKKKKPPEGFVTWNAQTFEKLCNADPEKLKPKMQVTHSMILACVMYGEDAYSRIRNIVSSSAQSPDDKISLLRRVNEIFATLITTGVVEKIEETCANKNGLDEDCVDEDGDTTKIKFLLTIDLPLDFALDQPLSPFLIAALDLLDPESENYYLDVISLKEATLDDPKQVLRSQQRIERNKAMDKMKALDISYEERIERVNEITYPKPLEELLEVAFEDYCVGVPWARDFEIKPKSVVRDMIETVSDFNTYVGRYKIERSEGTLLRYLSDAYKALNRTVPISKRNDQLEDVISWLDFLVRSVDSSLVSEWENSGTSPDDGQIAPPSTDAIVKDRRGVRLLVRNALFLRIRMASLHQTERLGELDARWEFGERKWRDALDSYFEIHGEILTDADARSSAFFINDEAEEKSTHKWHVRQIFSDPEQDHDFAIAADIDLDATQNEGEVVFSNFRVGFIEDL